jgi:hypothetical protein
MASRQLKEENMHTSNPNAELDSANAQGQEDQVEQLIEALEGGDDVDGDSTDDGSDTDDGPDGL